MKKNHVAINHNEMPVEVLLLTFFRFPTCLMERISIINLCSTSTNIDQIVKYKHSSIPRYLRFKGSIDLNQNLDSVTKKPFH